MIFKPSILSLQNQKRVAAVAQYRDSGFHDRGGSSESSKGRCLSVHRSSRRGSNSFPPLNPCSFSHTLALSFSLTASFFPSIYKYKHVQVSPIPSLLNPQSLELSHNLFSPHINYQEEQSAFVCCFLNRDRDHLNTMNKPESVSKYQNGLKL